jgi:KDO2-lipid IV(A) lauroyltransferase
MTGKSSSSTFRREERDEFRRLLSVWCAMALSWAFFLTPTPVRYWFADRLSTFTARRSRTYAANVRENVRQAHGGAISGEELDRAVTNIFKVSGRNFMDLITFARVSQRTFRSSITVVEGDWSILENAVAQGRGVIFVTGHVGCFDFLGHLFRARGYKLTIVTGRTTSRFVFDGVTWLRGAHGNTMVEPTPSGVRTVIRALRRGECAVFLSDRDFFQNGREVTLFGRETTLPPGAIRIARDTGAVIVPVFTRRLRRGHELRILESFTVPSTGDLEADLDAGMASLTEVLEDGIGTYADQWVMFQSVWPDEPPRPVRVFPVGSPLESELLEKVAAALPERKQDGGRGRLRRTSGPKTSGSSQTAAPLDSPPRSGT